MSIREEIYILHFQLSIFNFELSTDLKESQLQFRFFAHHVLVPLGFEDEIDGGGGYAVDGFHLLAHIFHDEVGCRTVGGSQRHVDGGFSLVGDVYFVNQSQVVYIYRYFRVEYGLEHGDYFLFYFKFGHIRRVLYIGFQRTKLWNLIENAKERPPFHYFGEGLTVGEHASCLILI